MVDDEYPEGRVEHEFSFIEVHLVDRTVGLALRVAFNQVVQGGFHLTRVVVHYHRITVDHSLRDSLQPLLAFRFVKYLFSFHSYLRYQPLHSLLLWVQDLARALGHQR